jgi:hypothetical protein
MAIGGQRGFARLAMGLRRYGHADISVLITWLVAGLLLAATMRCGALGPSGRAVRRVPDPAAMTAAVHAIIDSLGFCQIKRIWVAPDGGSSVMIGQDWRDMVWQIDANGRLLGRNWVSPDRGLSSEPLGEFRDGSILLDIEPPSGADPAPHYMVRVRAGRTMAKSGRIRMNAPTYRTVLFDYMNVAHLFGSRGFIVSGHTYARYYSLGGKLIELSHKLFEESTTVVLDSGYRLVKLPEAPPGWGRRWASMLEWDGPGRIVGAVLGYYSLGYITVYRFRIPQCQISDKLTFHVDSAAVRRYMNVDGRDIYLLRSIGGYWLFVPSHWDSEAADTSTPCMRVCRLDERLKPVLDGAATVETVLPYWEAPRGSGLPPICWTLL